MPTRTVKESPVERGVAETYPYSFTLTDKFPAGTYASPANSLYSIDADGKEYTTAVAGALTGSADITAGVFTTSNFTADSLTVKTRYRLNCSFTIDGLTWDFNLMIDARN